MKKVNILGTTYTIEFKNYDADTEFSERGCGGYCNSIEKKIVVCNMKTFPTYENISNGYSKEYSNTTLRHEIIHAFLYESGLSTSSHQTDSGWAIDEEMVDWLAIQSPKLLDIFVKLSII